MKWLLFAALSAQFFPGTNVKPADSKPAEAVAGREFEVADWVETTIDLNAGDTVRIRATGAIRYAGTPDITPAGTKKGWRDLLRAFPVNDADRGALVGRIGNAQPFLIGAEREARAPIAGKLAIGINQPKGERPEGAFKVTVDVSRGVAKPPVDISKLPRLTQQQLDDLPARVVDAEGTQGDRVNVVVIGSEQQIVKGLLNAGWVKVNPDKKSAVVGAALSVLSRRGYVEMPMSELLMFDRVQDYGFAHADPVIMVAARHHFRMWKAPFTAGGQQVWVIAGTHDVGFDKDQRNGKITHKIDPNTDGEREYIVETLKQSGEVGLTYFMARKDPVVRAKTAHGQEFYSDGKTHIVVMTPTGGDASVEFSALFCSVLRDNNPDGGEWGDCKQWIAGGDAKARVPLGEIAKKYRVLIVPGLMSSCFRGAPPFKEGVALLQSRFGLTVETVPVPNDSSEANAKLIAGFLRAKMQGDSRKYIVIGYSKGAPDFQTALARESGVKESTAAFVSVGGAVGGSPVAEAVPDMAEKWIRQYNMPNCEGDLAQGFKSLGYKVRKAFLASFPDPLVPSYAVAAVSTRENTSKMLMQTRLVLDAYSPKHDSQLTENDQLVPGGKYLGTALADHFAVALPFETSDESVKAGADKNHYPRSALLESIVRFVVSDLR